MSPADVAATMPAPRLPEGEVGMFLGTRRIWWIAAGLLFVGGLVLFSTEIGGMAGNVGGVLLIILGMVVFAAAPMRYGQGARPTAAEEIAAEMAPTDVEGIKPRVRIDAGDASEV
jgi:TRAP-type C4-dicarboxylate transport system permease small subunit